MSKVPVPPPETIFGASPSFAIVSRSSPRSFIAASDFAAPLVRRLPYAAPGPRSIAGPHIRGRVDARDLAHERAAHRPDGCPCGPCPGSMSTSTFKRLPLACAAASKSRRRPRRCRRPTISSFMRALSAITRAMPASVTTGDVIRIEFDSRLRRALRPRRASRSRRRARPPRSGSRAISTHLCVLACGRSDDADLRRMRGHARDVALEHVEIDHQRRRLEPCAPAGNADQYSFRFAIVPRTCVTRIHIAQRSASPHSCAAVGSDDRPCPSHSPSSSSPPSCMPSSTC